MSGVPITERRAAFAQAGDRRSTWQWLVSDPYRLVLCVLFLVTLPLGTHRVYASDEVQYFSYLHSVWFDHDLDFTNEYTYFVERYPESLAGFKRTNLDRITPTGEPIPSLTGLPIVFGPVGSAILWSPFYGLGHLSAVVLQGLGQPIALDGYSAPYIWAITIGSAVYSAAGLLLLHLLARRFVDRPTAFWATLAIWLGTPVIYYSHGTPAYSHATSLFAVTLFLWVWYITRPLLQRRWWQWVLVGLLTGLVTTVREQDGIIPTMVLGIEGVLVLPGLLRSRGWWPVARLSLHGALTIGAWLLAFSPQLVVYYVVNGAFRPSANVTEKVDYFLPTQAFNVMLAPEYGLIFWTPLVLVALPGLVWLWRRDRTLTLALALIFLATWYVSAVYSTGPSRGSFGARRFMSCTPVFLLGLAGSYQALRASGRGWLVPLISLLSMWWNIGLIVQYVGGLMSRQRLDLGVVLYNQLFVVPARLVEFAYRLLFARHTFFRN